MYFLMKLLLGPLLQLLYRPWSVGWDNIPKKGGAIIASSHMSFIDSIIISHFSKRKVHFLAKREYFTGRGFKGFLMRCFFRLTNQIAMDRSGGTASENSLQAALDILAKGRLLAIYPEGTRSHDGKLYRGRTGIARLVLKANVPVIPASVFNTHLAMPRGKYLPRFFRVGVIFGKQLSFERYLGFEGDRFVLRSITDEVMYEIYSLSGRQYTDAYASNARLK